MGSQRRIWTGSDLPSGGKGPVVGHDHFQSGSLVFSIKGGPSDLWEAPFEKFLVPLVERVTKSDISFPFEF